jgi:hypothetical protein
VSVLVLATVIAVAHIAEAKVIIGEVEKVADRAFTESRVFDKKANLWLVEIESGWI